MNKQDLINAIYVRKISTGTYLWSYTTPSGRKYEYTNHASYDYDKFTSNEFSLTELRALARNIRHWGKLC